MSESWRRKWQPTPVLLPGESHGQRSLAGYSPGMTRVGHDLATTPPPSPCLDLALSIGTEIGMRMDEYGHRCEYTLEGLILKLKIQYLGYLKWRDNSLEKTLMLGKTKKNEKRVTEDEMDAWHHWLNRHTSLSKFWEMVKDREALHAAVHGVAKSRTWLSDWTTTNWTLTVLQTCSFNPQNNSVGQIMELCHFNEETKEPWIWVTNSMSRFTQSLSKLRQNPIICL